MIRNVVLIGSGNLAEALARALARALAEGRETEGRKNEGCGAASAGAELAGTESAGAELVGTESAGAEPCAGAASSPSAPKLVQLWARNRTRAAAVAEPLGVPWSADPAALCRTADLYLLAVSDRAVAEAAAALPIPEEAVVAHTAGSVPLAALGRFPRRAILYPLQSFTAGRRVDFRTVPLFVECADAALRPDLEAFARTFGGEVRYADSDRRALIHLAGVFANNFANRMYGLAAEVLERAGLPYGLLKPLLLETAAKAAAAADPADVQTGPAVRGDRATQERHLRLLAQDPVAGTLYETISRDIWETSRKRSRRSKR